MRNSWICFLLCGLINLAAPAKIISIPLKKTDSPLAMMLKQNIHPLVIEKMIRAEEVNGLIPVPLSKWFDIDFYGEILFGKPGQPMKMSFDTTWIDSWVPTTTCSAISVPCALRSKYDPNRSPLSVRTSHPFNISYGISSLYGRFYMDMVHINQVNITRFSFGAVSEIPWFFVYNRFDGILGMDIGKNDLSESIISYMVDQKLVEHKVFSLYLNRNPLSKKGGTIEFGGVDKRHYKGEITYVNVEKTDPPQWMISANNITILKPLGVNVTACYGGCKVIMVSSTNLMSGPRHEIETINNAIGAKDFILDRSIVRCSTVRNLPKVIISIGNRLFKLNGENYVQEISMDVLSLCLSSFAPNSNPNDPNWYFGVAFMSKYYTTFDEDNMRIGFADAQL